MHPQIEMGAVEGDVHVGVFGCRRPLDWGHLDELGDARRGLPDRVVELPIDRRGRHGTGRRQAGTAREDAGRRGHRECRRRPTCAGSTPRDGAARPAASGSPGRVVIGQDDATGDRRRGDTRGRPFCPARAEPVQPARRGIHIALLVRPGSRLRPPGDCAAGGHSPGLAQGQSSGELCHDPVLQDEDLVDGPVGGQRLGDHAGPRVDQPRGDAQPLPDALVPAGHDPASAHGLIQVRGRRRVRRCRDAAGQRRHDRFPTDNHQPAERFEVGRHRLRDPVADPVVGGVPRDVRERPYRDRTRRRQRDLVPCCLARFLTGRCRLRGRCG